MKRICCILAALIFFSCSGDRMPGDILPPDKMEKLMWEQMRADAFTKDYLSRDSVKELTAANGALQEKIFRKYKTNPAVFYKSYDWYLQHNNMMRDLLDSIIAKEVRAQEKEKEVLKLKNEQNLR